MTRQKQIEEMAVIGCVRNPQAHTAEECSKCGFKQGMCNAYRHAEALYNAGYRKVPNDIREPIDLLSEGANLKEKLDEEECDIVDDYTIGFATYLMQKNSEKTDKLNAEIKRLKKENACLLKACEEQFTFDTTQNNSVRKEFAEKLKEKYSLYDDRHILYRIIDELLKEYE